MADSVPPPAAAAPAHAPVPNTSASLVAPPSPDFAIDDFDVNLSDYRKLKKAGDSASGGVYSMLHAPTGAVFAARLLHPDVADPAPRARYRREVVLLATLRHPAILPLHGCTPLDSAAGAAILTPLLGAPVQSHIDAEYGGAPPGAGRRRGSTRCCWGSPRAWRSSTRGAASTAA
jgi:hypothetical protein